MTYFTLKHDSLNFNMISDKKNAKKNTDVLLINEGKDGSTGLCFYKCVVS